MALSFRRLKDLTLLAEAHRAQVFAGYFRFPDDEGAASEREVKR